MQSISKKTSVSKRLVTFLLASLAVMIMVVGFSAFRSGDKGKKETAKTHVVKKDVNNKKRLGGSYFWDGSAWQFGTPTGCGEGNLKCGLFLPDGSSPYSDFESDETQEALTHYDETESGHNIFVNGVDTGIRVEKKNS